MVGYTVSWPPGRAGDEQGTVRFAAGDSTATATLLVPDDDVVGHKAHDVLSLALNQPGSSSGYTLGAAHTKDVTVLEGVCDRSEKVQTKILEAVTTATECHEVTDSDLSSAPGLTGTLYWGKRKLIPSKAGSPRLKAGDFRGMSGVTVLYLGHNELDRLPPGVFEGLSNLKRLFAANNSIKSLEPKVFEGLESLIELGLRGNAVEGGFVLKPELKRIDDDSFEVEIVEGAPLNVSVTLSALGGTLAPPSVTVPAGRTKSGRVMLSRHQVDSTVGVRITGASFASRTAYGVSVSGDDALNLPRPTVSVVGADVSAKEGSSAQVELSISPAPKVPFKVEYKLLYDDGDPNTVNGNSEDHEAVAPLELPAGATSGSVPVEITEDTDIDDGAREVLVFQLKDASDLRDYVLGTDISATITIKEGICDRTDAVKQAILDGLAKASDQCAEVTDAELSDFAGPLDLSGGADATPGDGIATLQSRDFMGLSSLTGLDSANATMVNLPPDVFDGLGLLATLSLKDGTLASLDAGVFSDLTSLETLRLDNNNLKSLPVGFFSGLPSLVTLSVADNDLAAIPRGAFVGLGSLMEVDFSGNDGAPFVLTAELAERESPDVSGGFGVAVLMADGSPGPMKVNLTASGAVTSNILAPMVSGVTESVVTPFDWTKSGDAKICIAPDTEGGKAFQSHAVTFKGLEFRPGPCLTVTPPGPKVEITDAQVSQIEGQNALISFALSFEATEAFDLRYITRPDGIEGTVDATEGVDYTATGVHHVLRGETVGKISIPILDDTEIDEGIHELFVVELTGPVNGESYHIVSTDITSTVTIKDGICDRSQIVQKAIIGKLTGTPSCHDVTEKDLNGIQGTMTLAGTTTPIKLQAGEFGGLSDLGMLRMSSVNLSPGLPLGLFEGLNSVNGLFMCFSQISSLDAGVFAGLDSITLLAMDNNAVNSLPANLFRDVPTLHRVRLYSNGITSLDGDVFRDATALSIVELNDNKLSALPPGLFASLTNLSDVRLHGNSGAPFVLTASIRDEGDGSFAVQIPEGAPFEVSVPFTLTGGKALVSSVTIPAGALVSDSVEVTWDQSNTGNVKVTPSTPKWAAGPTVNTMLTGASLAAGNTLEISPP